MSEQSHYCTRCDGSGDDPESFGDCAVCNGNGKVCDVCRQGLYDCECDSGDDPLDCDYD